MPGNRFCSGCGAQLSPELRDTLKTLALPPEPNDEPLQCLGCGAALELAQVLEPVYAFISGDRDERASPESVPYVDKHAGKTLLPHGDALGSYAGMRRLSPPARAALLEDPALAAYARVQRLSRAAGRPRGGYSLSGLVVLDCPHCRRPDPTGLLSAVEAGEAAIRRLPP
jgi:hypothetical protein